MLQKYLKYAVKCGPSIGLHTHNLTAIAIIAKYVCYERGVLLDHFAIVNHFNTSAKVNMSYELWRRCNALILKHC